jgi:hypothetical protein
MVMRSEVMLHPRAAASLQSRNGTTLGGGAVTANGDWKPKAIERLRTAGGECEISVPAASAAIVILGA